MKSRFQLSHLGLALVLATACDGAPDTAVIEADTVPIAGQYEVSGTTIETKTGSKRQIAGTVILAEDGDDYTATFHLATVFESASGAMPAEVIGKGSGTINGRELRGTAETQVVISTVPGIDPAFAFIPRMTSTRIVSNSVTSIAADGSVVIQIENQPAAGEDYAPSRTALRGNRIGASLDAGGNLPPIAAIPAEEAE
jgi:hypothetical protein